MSGHFRGSGGGLRWALEVQWALEVTLEFKNN